MLINELRPSRFLHRRYFHTDLVVGGCVQLSPIEVAIYNIVGRLQVVGGTGDRVVVEVTRGGRDAAQLRLITGDVRGRMSLRVRYPADRIVYPQSRWNGRSPASPSHSAIANEN